MKLWPVIELYKKIKTPSKISDNDVISANCDVNTIFSIYGQFGEIRKPDSGQVDCNTCIFINSNLFILQNLKTELKRKHLQRNP